MKQLSVFFVLIMSLMLVCCGGDFSPKPNAFLRLEYPAPIYELVITEAPFTFEKNKQAIPAITSVSRDKSQYALNISYPRMKATIYLSYIRVGNNLDSLLRDAQNITQKHTGKADGILPQAFENKQQKLYGMYYEVLGNAASQAQFYVTDTVNHFVAGSLYFYAKPNYDSIKPAAAYLQNDMKRIMESIEWIE